MHTGEGRDRKAEVFQDRRAYVRNNDRDTATLRNDHGKVVEALARGLRGDLRGNGGGIRR
ncbi:hypothetical protein ACGFWD_43750 [Streptomyces sp. NPDC048448]|uniref:hypothetical protein n=1 Tax=unclassified Streptomyces TaxID=2593676 RepID=UPI0034247D99